jgi:hypothetical protein
MQVAERCCTIACEEETSRQNLHQPHQPLLALSLPSPSTQKTWNLSLTSLKKIIQRKYLFSQHF